MSDSSERVRVEPVCTLKKSQGIETKHYYLVSLVREEEMNLVSTTDLIPLLSLVNKLDYIAASFS